MLKRRIIAVLVLLDGIVVQSIGFKRYLPVGSPEICIEFLNEWGIDEIIVLDILASKNKSQPNYSLIKKISSSCLVPLAYGGGINDIDQIHELMHCGVDKIILNSALFDSLELLVKASSIFGSQCMIASIDSKLNSSSFDVFNYKKNTCSDLSVIEWALKLVDHGVGEVFLNDVDRDGAKCGYNIDLVRSLSDLLPVPLICCGGAGNPHHINEVLSKTSVDAVAASNYFHFYEHSVTIAKSLACQSHSIRHETFFTYTSHDIDHQGRLLKLLDDDLTKLLFTPIQKEVI